VATTQGVVKEVVIDEEVSEPHIPVTVTVYVVLPDNPVTFTVTAPEVEVPEAEATVAPVESVVV
jgi:hypothetical protein